MVWQKAAQIYASLFQQGRPIDEGDYLIAACCIVNDFTLVTNNVRHFERVEGLKIANWNNGKDPKQGEINMPLSQPL